jgi:hypothetical protein
MPVPKLRSFNNIEHPDCLQRQQKLSDAKKIFDILFDMGFHNNSIWDIVFCWDQHSADQNQQWAELEQDKEKLAEIINSKLQILEEFDFAEFIDLIEENT